MQLSVTWKNRKCVSITIVAALFMFFFLPFIQVLGIGSNIDLWYKILLETNYGLNAVLFIVFCILFGMFVSFQIYKFGQPKVCPVGRTAGKGVLGYLGSVLAFFVGVCPACLGFAGLLLPLSVVTTLVVFGPIFILISIVLIFLSIHINGGFKKKLYKS